MNENSYYYEKNNLISFLYVIIYISLFCLIIYLLHYSSGIYFIVLLLLFLGLFQAGFNQGKHEFLHDTVFTDKYKYLNKFLWYFFSIPILVNPNLNKDFHLNHHKYLGTDKDPELTSLTRKGYSLIEIVFYRIFHPSVLDSIYINLNIIIFRKYPSYVYEEKNKKSIYYDAVLLIIFHIITISFLIYLQDYYFIFLRYICLEFIGRTILSMFDLSEHRGCDLKSEFDHSRTIKSNFIITFVTWYNNYHSVHHVDKPTACIVFYKRKEYFDSVNKYQTKKIENSYIGLMIKMFLNPDKYI